LTNAGIEPLYSGVEINRPSCSAISACNRRALSGKPSASMSPS
jgi:hypothetical protein